MLVCERSQQILQNYSFHFKLCNIFIDNCLQREFLLRSIVSEYTNVIFNTVMKAVIYSRVSTNKQSNGRQINELKAVPDFEVVKVFEQVSDA